MAYTPQCGIFNNMENHLKLNQNQAISATKLWLEQVIIKLNFCPFAKKEYVNNRISYVVSDAQDIENAIACLINECLVLDRNNEIETTLLMFNAAFENFEDYLDLLDVANDTLSSLGYEGVYQLASFHPDYVFEGEGVDDASNYTNRSPLPTLHLIREASMEKVLAIYPKPEEIPINNIELAQNKGSEYFKKLTTSFFETVTNEKN